MPVRARRRGDVRGAASPVRGQAHAGRRSARNPGCPSHEPEVQQPDWANWSVKRCWSRNQAGSNCVWISLDAGDRARRSAANPGGGGDRRAAAADDVRAARCISCSSARASTAGARRWRANATRACCARYLLEAAEEIIVRACRWPSACMCRNLSARASRPKRHSAGVKLAMLRPGRADAMAVVIRKFQGRGPRARPPVWVGTCGCAAADRQPGWERIERVFAPLFEARCRYQPTLSEGHGRPDPRPPWNTPTKSMWRV